MESTYTNGLKFIFRSLRRERDGAIRFFYEAKMNLKEFLVRPDRKQAILDAFQKEFNAIEDDLRYVFGGNRKSSLPCRSDADAKAEFHQRAEDLRERLWMISDERKEEAEGERLAIIENRWVEDHMAVVANLYINAIQLEIDRYVATKQILLDYTKDTNELVIIEPIDFQMSNMFKQIIDDGVLNSPKVELVNISNIAESLFQEIARIKHDAPAALLPANVLRKTTGSTAGPKKGVPQKKTAEKQETSGEAPQSSFSEHPFESDDLHTTMSNAFNTAMNIIAEMDFNEVKEVTKDKNDKKKGAVEIPVEIKGIIIYHPRKGEECC